MSYEAIEEIMRELEKEGHSTNGMRKEIIMCFINAAIEKSLEKGLIRDIEDKENMIAVASMAWTDLRIHLVKLKYESQ